MKNIARCKKWRILAGMAILGMPICMYRLHAAGCRKSDDKAA